MVSGGDVSQAAGEEERLMQALRIGEAKLATDDVAAMPRQLGVCARQAGRPGEAEELYRRALEIVETKSEADDLQIAYTLHELGVCARKAGRPGEAEASFQRALEIREAELGPDDLQAAYTRHELGQCAREAGRLEEAEALYWRALEIKEARLGPDHVDVAWTLHGLGRCVLEAGRPGEAEELFRRALQIEEARLGPEHVDIACTLQELGRCLRKAGRPGEAEELLWRTLEIREARLGPDHKDVARTLQELGRCALAAGRPGGAEGLFRRALQIEEARLGPDHMDVAWTLYELGRCLRKAGRPGEAEALFRRELAIREARLGVDHVDVAWTLQELGRCAREAGRPVEAEALYRRVIEIKGADHVDVAWTLQELDRCVREARRPTETAPGSATGKKCYLVKRRRHHLFALALGVLEVYFSVYNVVVEDAKSLEDGKDFVFYSSAIMESVGLALMLLIGLLVSMDDTCAEMVAQFGDEDDGDMEIGSGGEDKENDEEDGKDEEGEEGGEEGEEKGKYFLEEVGSPLAILVSGIHQKDSRVTNAGFLGSLAQALVVFLVSLDFVDKRAGREVLYIVCVCLIPVILVVGAIARSTALFLKVTCVFILLPICVDVAEVVFLLLGGESWRAMILAILDIFVTCTVVFPWVLKIFTASVQQVPSVVRQKARAVREGYWWICLGFRMLLLVLILFLTKETTLRVERAGDNVAESSTAHEVEAAVSEDVDGGTADEMSASDESTAAVMGASEPAESDVSLNILPKYRAIIKDVLGERFGDATLTAEFLSGCRELGRGVTRWITRTE
ncbi:unnamed protein product [Scytosiphon promiscuus]